MRRAAIVTTGLLLGFLAAVIVLGAGLLAEAAGLDPATSIAVLETASRLGANGSSVLLGRGATVLWLGVLAVCFAPLALVSMVGEVARWREPIAYGAATGALAAAVPTLVRAAFAVPVGRALSPAEGRLTLLFFLTGVASGLLYWAVAGRTARD